MTAVASQSEESALVTRGAEASTPPKASHSPQRTMLFSARTETWRRGAGGVGVLFVAV